MIENELRAGEKIYWKGNPRQGLKLRASDIFLIPFSLLWGGFAIFWEFTATSIPAKNAAPAATIFPLFGIPFVLVGLYIIIGRFFADAQIRKNTEYAVTNERAIIVSGLFSRKVKSINLKSISDISVSEKSDGSGTITFGESASPYGWWMNAGFFPGMRNQVPAFEMIENVKNVDSVIRKSQKGE